MPVKDLPRQAVKVMSAGVYAGEGVRATPEAAAAAAELGADLADHRSQRLTAGLINEADMIFCMTDAHVEQVLAIDPTARDRTVRLSDEGEIGDPVGGGSGIYRRTARQIRAALQRRLEKGLP